MEQLRVDLYTQPRCVQCDATKRTLDKFGPEDGLHYMTHDVSVDEEAKEYLVELGFRQVPVVILSEVDSQTGELIKVVESISGYRPDFLRAIAKQVIARSGGLEDLGLTLQELHDQTPAPHHVS